MRRRRPPPPEVDGAYDEMEADMQLKLDAFEKHNREQAARMTKGTVPFVISQQVARQIKRRPVCHLKRGTCSNHSPIQEQLRAGNND